MTKNKTVTSILILTMLVMLASCEKPVDPPDSGKTPSILDITNNSEQSSADFSADKPKIELNHTYATRFEEVNFVTYPTFFFDYPDGWSITSEEVTPTSEEVILSNDRGTTVTYWNFGGMRDLTGPTRNINCVDVTRASDASFCAGYVQADDYSDLGAFIVAKIKITGEYDMDAGGEYIKVDNGSVRYALLPESQLGEQQECIIVGLPTFSFWYAGHISLIADAPDGEFTEQEAQEVIAILSSFRDTPTPSASVGDSLNPGHDNTATTIEELWGMLEGTWDFEEYEHMGKVVYYKEHTMEFHYVDGKPCMSKYSKSQEDNGYFPDDIFYDFSAIDTSHYIAYIYKKGSYGSDWGNWGDDVLSAWYSFDLSNLSDGELLIGYHMSWDNGFVDNNHLYKYSLA